MPALVHYSRRKWLIKLCKRRFKNITEWFN